MKLHPNAKTTPAARRLLIDRVQRGWTVRRAAEAVGISIRTAYKWLARYREEGPAGLADRSCRPHRSPHCTSPRMIERIERLRRRRRTAWEIAEQLELAPSTVSRILKRHDLGRLWRIDEAKDPPQRYEHRRPGSLVHIDAKRFARFTCVGHRIHGNRAQRARGVGYEVVFVCIDDCTRLAYAEVLPAENARHATAFLRRALRWFSRIGIRVERVLSDNARCYGSKAFKALCGEQAVRQVFTRPYTPRTNGKAERFIQTLIRRWAYARSYRTSAFRAAALPAWIKHYNHQRPHRAIGMRPPFAKLRECREQPA